MASVVWWVVFAGGWLVIAASGGVIGICFGFIPAAALAYVLSIGYVLASCALGVAGCAAVDGVSALRTRERRRATLSVLNKSVVAGVTLSVWIVAGWYFWGGGKQLYDAAYEVASIPHVEHCHQAVAASIARGKSERDLRIIKHNCATRAGSKASMIMFQPWRWEALAQEGRLRDGGLAGGSGSNEPSGSS